MRQDGSGNPAEEHNAKENEHSDLYHWVYVAGTTFLVGIVDFIFLLPENHLLAFLVVASWLSLVAIYELRKRLSVSTMIAVILLIFLLSIVIAIIVGPVHLPDTEAIGTLVPGHGSEPNACDAHPTDPNSLTIILGTNAVVGLPSQNKITALEIGRPPNLCDILSLERNGSSISVISNLYDRSGALVAQTYNNEFHAIVGDSSYIERHGDLSRLTVLGRTTWFRLWTTDHELLDISYVNPTTIKVRGTFSCPGHAPITFDESGQLGNGAVVSHNCSVGAPGFFHYK
jgi:hypothetical protein